MDTLRNTDTRIIRTYSHADTDVEYLNSNWTKCCECMYISSFVCIVASMGVDLLIYSVCHYCCLTCHLALLLLLSRSICVILFSHFCCCSVIVVVFVIFVNVEHWIRWLLVVCVCVCRAIYGPYVRAYFVC